MEVHATQIPSRSLSWARHPIAAFVAELIFDADEAERLLTRLKILAVKKPPAKSVQRRGGVRRFRAG
jgi:hypothetical protein